MICRTAGRTGRLFFSFLATTCLTLLIASPALADMLKGRVVDPTDHPVAAATVLVLRGPVVVSTITTHDDGEFGPVKLAPGTYQLAVVATGLRLPATTVTITATGDVTLTLKLALAAVDESIVVSASQIDAPVSRVPDSVTIVGRETIARQQLTGIADALRLVPGFGVMSSGGAGAITSIFPRGGESDYTLVLVDGIEQNAFGGGFDAAHLDTADVERIEVVRGPQSALYGAGAIGGIVHIITTHGGALRGTVQVEGGGYGTKSSSGSISGSHGAITFGGGLDWLRSDGDTSTRPVVGKISNDDYERASGSGSIGWSDRASRKVRFDVKIGRNERGYPGPFGSDPSGFFSGVDTVSRGTNHTQAVGGSATLAQGQSLFHQAQVNWSGAKSDYASPYGPSMDQTHRTTARYQVDLERSRLGLSAGAEWLDERANNTYITDATFAEIPVTRNATGLFVEARPALGGRVVTNVGLRIERLERSALDGDGFSRPVFNSQVVWSANPKVALAWFARQNDSTSKGLLGWTKLRLGAGTGIKSPTAFDIAFTDNPDLKPERSRSVDVGIEQALSSSRLVVDATWFHNQYDDLIVSVGTALTGASKFKTDNIANARAQGLEVGGSWHPVSAIAARVGWTWLDTEVLGVDNLPSKAAKPFVVGQRLLRRPRSAGSMDLTWAGHGSNLFVSLNGRGTMLDLEPNFAGSVFDGKGFVTTTIGGAYQAMPGIAVYGRVTNAFDRQYEETLGYPARGRSAFIGVRVTSRH